LDDTYQSYVNRVARLTLPETHRNQLLNLQPSPKYQQGRPAPFPGYSIVTPPGPEDPLNQALYEQLVPVQQTLQEIFGTAFCALPPASFHLTLADLIWDGAYQDAIAENPQFATDLKQLIQQSFQGYQPVWSESGCLQWQVLGLLVFPRAVAVALAPKGEADYPPIVELRRSLYQNQGLMGLGVEQQYHFTAHISLGYFDQVPDLVEGETVLEKLSQVNDQWLVNDPQFLQIQQVELRYFSDMTYFTREPTDPVLQLTQA
jgi:hypothetical protein